MNLWVLKSTCLNFRIIIAQVKSLPICGIIRVFSWKKDLSNLYCSFAINTNHSAETLYHCWLGEISYLQHSTPYTKTCFQKLTSVISLQLVQGSHNSDKEGYRSTNLELSLKFSVNHSYQNDSTQVGELLFLIVSASHLVQGCIWTKEQAKYFLKE